MSSEGDDSDSRHGSAVTRLSPRQQQCLQLVHELKTTKEIATLLGISMSTVDSYLAEAVALLGARNRRHAAVLLHAFNPATAAANPPPSISPPGSSRDAEPPCPEPLQKKGSGDWRRLLPFRIDGEIGNDLGIGARLTWIIFGAVAIAIGLGMLADAVDVVGKLYRAAE